MTRIFIEGKEIDVEKDVVMDLNYAIADIMELDKRNTQFSKTILIPDSHNNRSIFGYVAEIAVQNPYVQALPNVGLNFNPTKKAQAVIYKDNIAVFKGICRLISVTSVDGEVNYEINLFGRLKDILYALGDKYIHELDWTDQDFVYDIPTFLFAVVNKQFAGDQISNQEYSLPLVDYGHVVDLNKWDWKDLQPQVFVREVLIRMFKYAGFVHTPSLFAPFFDTNYFRHLMIINGEFGLQQFLKDILEFQVNQEGFVGPCTTNLNVCTFNHWSPLTQITNNGGLFTYMTNPTSTCPNPNRYSLKYNGTTPLTIDLSFDLKIRWDFVRYQTTCFDPQTGQGYTQFVPSSGIFGAVYIGLTDASGNFQNVLYSRTKQFIQGGTISYQEEWVVNFAQQVTINPGQWFTMRADANFCPLNCADFDCICQPRAGLLRVDWTSNGYDGRIKMGFPVITSAPVAVGSTIKFADIMPRGIKCVDLLKTIILMHNLYVEQDDNQENLLHITPHIFYYDYDITKSADWSYKLAYDKEIKIIPLSELKAQKYNFSYESDNDYFSEAYSKKFNQEYGEKTEYIDNDFLDTEENIKSIFSPCVVVKPTSVPRVYISLYELDGTTKKRGKFKPRIAYYNNDNIPSPNWEIKDGNTIISILNRYPYAGHFDHPTNPTLDINWSIPKEVYFDVTALTGNNLYEAFWKKLISEISDKDSRLLVAYFDLKGEDVEDIDFARLIKINNQYYKIMKIENYNPNGDTLAKVSLLKVLYDTNYGELSFILQEDNPFILQENGTNRFYI